MPFPSPPWLLQGRMWVSLFWLRTGTVERPAGLYGAAFVDYAEGGVLSYRELLVARLVRERAAPRVHITDIWVDSVASRDGGRALWAIPKELAGLQVERRTVGPAVHVRCEASVDGAAVAAARFATVRAPSLRTPFRFTVRQHRPDGTPVASTVTGSSRNLPVVGSWDIDPEGRLGWLHGRRPWASFAVDDFAMTFGG